MKYLFTNTQVSPNQMDKLPFNLSVKQIGDFHFLTDSAEEIMENESFAGNTEGYLRDLNFENKSTQEHTLSAYQHILKQWPLSENITGSFSKCGIVFLNLLIGPRYIKFRLWKKI